MARNFEVGKTYLRRDGVAVEIVDADAWYSQSVLVVVVRGDDLWFRFDESGEIAPNYTQPEDLVIGSEFTPAPAVPPPLKRSTTRRILDAKRGRLVSS